MQFSPYLVLIAVLIAVISCVIAATYRYIAQKTARYVFAAMLLALAALFCFGLSLLILDTKTRFFFHEMKFLPLAFLAPFSLITYLEFTGKGRLLNKTAKLSLFVIPAITAVIAMTNNYHHFFRQDLYIVMHNGVSYVGATPSWWYWIYSIYSYLLYICGIVVLFVSFFRMPRVYRDQTGILVATVTAAIMMGIVSLLHLFPDYGDASLVCCAMVCVAQYIAIVRYSKNRVTDKCRSLILGDMNGYVLIYNHMDHLVDVSKTSADDVCRVIDANAFHSGTDSIGRELRIPSSGKCYSVSEKYLFDEKGHSLGHVLLLSDITDMKKVADELEYTATHDYLTNLPNKNVFQTDLQKLAPEDLPAALIYICILDMKMILGIFGYEYADRLIVQITENLKLLAKDEICARLNGDEMGIILKRSGAAEAEAFIAKVKEYVLAGRNDLRVEIGYTVVSSPDTDAARAFADMADRLRSSRKSEDRSIRPELMAMLLDALSKLRDGTGERTAKVADLCRRLSEKLALDESEARRLDRLAALADIGLLSADPELVKSIGNLTNEQWEEFKQHTMRGYSIAMSAHETEDIAHCILSHHERYDGHGYPSGLRGDEIPIAARIYAAAEFYVDTPPSRVCYLLRVRAGTQFDPDVVHALLELTKE